MIPGIRKASVFPEPVWAIPIKTLRYKMKGNAKRFLKILRREKKNYLRKKFLFDFRVLVF
jgi:hypothetical protein